jgi:hypothetical protein
LTLRSRGWHSRDWTASDDRVRGGKSSVCCSTPYQAPCLEGDLQFRGLIIKQSHLQCDSNQAIFLGTLDIETLGGAGFASQRTASDSVTWDLSSFEGIELQLDAKKSDGKQYTFIFKDHLPNNIPNSVREQSSLSWEADFMVSGTSAAYNDDIVSVYLPWDVFKPTYRGKEQKCKEGPALGSIKRMSIMMRRYSVSLPRD